jgi:hypothetical protein
MSNRASWIALAVVAGLQLFAAPALAGASENSFKGIELGMSLDRFMQTEFPDRHRLLAGHTTIPRSFRAQCGPARGKTRECWFEAWGGLAPTCKKDMPAIIEHLRMAHKAASKYLDKGPFTEEGARQQAYEMCYMRIDVGYGGSSPSYAGDIRYLFFANRLMRIDINIKPAEVDRLVPQLVGAYGEPAANDEAVLQNSFGATFNNQIIQWDNGQTTVLVKRYDGRTDTGHFSYTHKATAGRYQADKVEANSDAAKDF